MLQTGHRYLLALAIATGLAGRAQFSSGDEPARIAVAVPAPAPPSADRPSRDPLKARFLGVASCAASNCHGGDGIVRNEAGEDVRSPLGSEYSIWVQSDPHAEAYTVLFNETSKRMARLMKLDKPAHEAALCLNCHGPQSEPPFDGHVAAHDRLLDGVSCEACHGAASEWLSPHVSRDWKRKTPEEKAALGFKNTKDMWTRAAACADCHVGAPGRDVNHDLYAAGHPRLFFELSAFNANLPAHWDRAKDRQSVSGGGFEARLWAIGQLASADAALELLEHRAERAEDTDAISAAYPAERTVPVWPEFAETACFACHHDLAAPSWRQVRGYSGRRPGQYPWGTWLFPLVPSVSSLAGMNLEGPDSALTKLNAEMARPYPDRQISAKAARDLRLQLATAGRQLASKPLNADGLRQAMDQVAERGIALSRQDWDGATQSYLALVALHQAYRDEQSGGTASEAGSKPVLEALERIRSRLEFPVGFDSPQTFSTDPAEAVVRDLELIRTSLKAGTN